MDYRHCGNGVYNDDLSIIGRADMPSLFTGTKLSLVEHSADIIYTLF